MLIRCKQIRPNGTEVVFGKTAEERRVYKFKPRDPNRPGQDHVCDVTDQRDLASLLAIPEGFEIHPSAAGARLPEPASTAPSEPPGPAKTTAPKASKTAGQAAAVDKAALLKAVEEKTGKRPNPATSVAKLQAMLAA